MSVTTTGKMSRAKATQAIMTLAANPPTGPGDIEVWLEACACWLKELLRVTQDLKRVLGAHAFLTDILVRQAWTHQYLAAKGISERLSKTL